MAEFLNEDLTTVEGITPFLKQCTGKGKEIPVGSILQVQQLTNVSFATYDKPVYDSDKHTLKITVTDGQSQGYALVPESCPGINLNTPPGTKLKITQPIPVNGNLFILNRNNCEVLGGRVAKLYEKWDMQRKHAFKHEWGQSVTAIDGEGPPPWKPFGYSAVANVNELRKMKTVDVVNGKKEGSGTAKTQFDVQRDEAISELQAAVGKQKFQKPNKHLVEKEIQDIMDEGFSQTDAEYAMGRFKNTQKALKFLKESKNRQDGVPIEPPKPLTERKDRRKGKGKGLDEDEEQEVPKEYQRPTKSISLFGFIEGQIKADTKASTQPNTARGLESSLGNLTLRESKSDHYLGRGGEGSYGRGGYRGRGGGRDSGRGGSRSGGRDNGRGGGRDFDRSGGGDHRDHQYQDNKTSRYDNRHDNTNRHENNPRYEGNTPRVENSQRYDNSSHRPDNNLPRYDNKVQPKTDPTQRPPRFQNRGSENRPSEYTTSSSRNPPGGGHDSYRDREQSKDNYGSKSYQDNRQDYSSGNYQSQYQRSQPAKERTFTSDYQQQQQQYTKSNDYPVPSQTYHQSYQQPPPQQRHYNNTGSLNHEQMGPRGGGPQRSQYGRGGHNQSQGEFTNYQYGFEGYNPAQSLVFTRSKPDGRGPGRGGYQGNGRGAAQQNNAYGGSNHGNRY